MQIEPDQIKGIKSILVDAWGTPPAKQAAIELTMSGITEEMFSEFMKTPTGQSLDECWTTTTFNELRDMVRTQPKGNP